MRKLDMPRHEVFEILDGERKYQDEVWTEEASLGEYILIMEELLSQARHSWQSEKEPEMNTRNLMRKIVATGVRCLENYPSQPRINLRGK